MTNELRERAIRIIRGLMDKTVAKGCTPAEAAHAAAKVQELLEKYQLSILDVKGRTLHEAMGRTAVRTGRKTRNPGECSLAMAVGAGYDCQVVSDHEPEYTYHFLGYESDAEVARYVFIYLRDALTALADEQGRKAGASKAKLVRWKNNFLLGAAGEIRRRMLEERDARHRREDSSPVPAEPTKATGTALVRIKQPAVAAYVRKQYPRLYKSKIRVKNNYNALEAGRETGRTIPIRKAVEHSPSPLLGGSGPR